MSKNIEKFENHMDVSNGEMSGDAEKVSDFEERPDDYNDEFESKMRQSKTFVPNFEKAMTYVSAVEALVNAFNNTQEPSDKIKKNIESQVPLTSISTGSYDYMDLSARDILKANGFDLPDDESEDSSFTHKLGEVIEAVGSDEDEALTMPEEQKEERDTIIDAETAIANDNDSSQSLDIPPSITAFSSIVSENYEYGSGGGKQIFIPNANEYKSNGTLEKIDELFETNSTENSAIINQDVTLSDYSYYDGETEYLDEIDYLDRNTIDTDGLNMVVDEKGNSIDQEKEDYIRPHSNQEDSDGVYYPDSWKKTEIRDGDILYQLSIDGNTPSSYFTDQMTVDSCTHNGVIDFKELRDKLQVANGKDKVCLTSYRCNIT